MIQKTSRPDKYLRARRADERDAEVGQRVKTKRLEKGLSQTELADRSGVTFQQIQKYEKGVNRIGAGRLQRIAEALEVPVQYFFDAPANGGSVSNFELLQTSDSVRVAQAFGRIASRTARRIVVALVEELAGGRSA